MSETEFDRDRWRREIEHDREQKDRFFAEYPHSPVPEERRDAFDGLDCCGPDPVPIGAHSGATPTVTSVPCSR